MMLTHSGSRYLAVAVMLLAAAIAHAGTISNVIFRVEASNAEGWGYAEFTSDQLVYHSGNHSYTWGATATDIFKNGDPLEDAIAVLNSAALLLVSSPAAGDAYRMNLGFNVTSGLSDTRFTIWSPKIGFGSTIPASMLQAPGGGGRATASIGITDNDGNGATLEGYGPPGIGAYVAQYNGFPVGTEFTDLCNYVFANEGASGSASQQMPPMGTGNESIPVAVSDMSVALDFTLTYGDAGSGTTTYKIVPEPAATVLFMLAGLAALAARRR